MRGRAAAAIATAGLVVVLIGSVAGAAWALRAGPFGSPTSHAGTQHQGRPTPPQATSPPGAAATPTPAPTPSVARPWSQPADFQAGFNILVYAHDQSAASSFPAVLDRLVSDNVNCLSLVFPIYTGGLDSDSVTAGAETPPDALLDLLIGEARARGLSVLLRPLLDQSNLGAGWRGQLAPASVPAWFASYDQLIVHYAQVAQQQGVQILDIGSELTSMEGYVTNWQQLIAQVRQVFKGQVTYSFNWVQEGSSFQTGFWPQLDAVSIDAYFPLDAPAGATAAEMAAGWGRWIALIQQANQPFHKPIVFTELGVVPEPGAYQTPWLSNVSSQIDLQEQTNYYQAGCTALPGVLAGLYWWTGTLSLVQDPQHDLSYTPLGKPAEAVMQTCFASWPQG